MHQLKTLTAPCTEVHSRHSRDGRRPPIGIALLRLFVEKGKTKETASRAKGILLHEQVTLGIDG